MQPLLTQEEKPPSVSCETGLEPIRQGLGWTKRRKKHNPDIKYHFAAQGRMLLPCIEVHNLDCSFT